MKMKFFKETKKFFGFIIAIILVIMNFSKKTKFFGFIITIIVSIITNICFLHMLDELGYFSWAYKCYGETLELLINIKNITFLKYWKVMLSDVAVIMSGLIVLFFIFDWIPNGIMYVLGYKSNKLANENIDDEESK